MKAQLLKILFTMLFYLILATTAYANLQAPAAPSSTEFVSPISCQQYAKKMQEYLEQFTRSDVDFENKLYFVNIAQGGARFPSSGAFRSTTSETCVNGKCTKTSLVFWGISYNEKLHTYYGANSLCNVVGTNAQSAKNRLLQNLQRAYKSAIAHQPIEPVLRRYYGLFGDPSVCTSNDNFRGCQLLSEMKG